MSRTRSRLRAAALATMLAVLSAVQAPAAEKTAKQIPAFPGAEGFGSTTPGGRGGRIIEVTNLNTKGPGSLQAACGAKGPRIVVFRVSGQMQGTVRVGEPFITIAGQTAPGDGICIRNGMLSVGTHDVIIRYLRARAGDEPIGPDFLGDDPIGDSATRPWGELVGPGLGRDVIGVSGGKSWNVIIDHCSASWGTDENMNASAGPHNPTITYQWCITSEALADSIHVKGPHSMGSLLGNGKGAASISIHHCLLAHNAGRNPLISNIGTKNGGIFDFRNNVIYNYTDPPPGYYRGVWSQILGNVGVNYVGNFLRLGIAGNKGRPGSIGIAPYNPYDKKYGPAKVYARDNIWPGNTKGERDDWEILEPIVKGKRKPARGFACLPEPLPVPPVTTESPAQAYENVLKSVGCTRPVRDVVDARIIQEVRAGRGRIIDSQRDVGGWPTYASTEPPADSDHDAMPDAWEKRYGFNPNNPADGPKDRDGDGYTNVEEFLNLTDPAKPDTGAPIPHPPVAAQAGNDRVRGEAARKIGAKRLARLKRPNATRESARVLRKKVRESGREVADLLGIKFAKIPAGHFMLSKIKVTHTKPYELSACEITQAQWETVMGTRPWSGQAAAKDNPRFPVTYVNYLDCQEFIRRLNACGVRKYRLPTACEWFYAARAGTEFKYGFGGPAWRRFHEHAWCLARVYNEKGRMVGKRVPKAPQAVGRLKPNPWGLYDMSGNAREWVRDWHWDGLKQSDATDCMGPMPEKGRRRFRMTCGGHFRYFPGQVMRYGKARHRPHYRSFGMGFRLQRALQ